MSLTGLLRRIRTLLLRRTPVRAGSCRMCGACCRKIGLLVDSAWLRTEGDFARCLERHPEYRRFRIAGRSPSGYLLFSCDWLGPDNLCLHHDQRLDICVRYPAQAMYFQGGDCVPGCGFRFEERKDFARLLSSELRG